MRSAVCVAVFYVVVVQDVAGRFEATYGDRGLTASHFEMNDDFYRVLQSQMVGATQHCIPLS